MIVTYQDLPPKIRGATVRSYDDGEDYYTIILNARLSAEEQQAAYRHEMYHIENNDFDSDEPIDVIERRAHELRDYRQE